DPGVAPEPEPLTCTDPSTVGFIWSDGVGDGPTAMLVEPGGPEPREPGRSFRPPRRLPCWTWRPTASTCGEPVDTLGSGEGWSLAVGVATPTEGPERTIIW